MPSISSIGVYSSVAFTVKLGMVSFIFWLFWGDDEVEMHAHRIFR